MNVTKDPSDYCKSVNTVVEKIKRRIKHDRRHKEVV